MRANFSVLIRTKRSLFISLLLPMILLFSWNNKHILKTFGGNMFVLAIVTTIGVMSLSIFGYALNVARDRENGVFQRLRVTPAPTWTIMISRILVQEISNLIIAAIVLIIGTRLYHVSIGAEQYILVLLISLLGGAVFLSVAQAIVALIKSADAVNAVARLVFIALLLLGLLGLSGTLGNTIRTIARWSPFGAIVQVIGGVSHIGPWTINSLWALIACLGYIVIFSLVGIKYFQWESR